MDQMSLVSQTLSLLVIAGCIRRPMFMILQVQKMLPKTKTHSSNTTIWDFNVKILYIFLLNVNILYLREKQVFTRFKVMISKKKMSCQPVQTLTLTASGRTTE